MIVLNKKRITLILSGIFLSIFVFILTTNNSEDQETYISTVSLPVSGKIIVVDARTSEFQMKGHKVAMVQQKQKPI